MARIFGIIPAAGSSSRMHASCSKVLLPLGAETVIQRTFRLLSTALTFERFVVLAANADQAVIAKLLAGRFGSQAVIPGGATRQQSVALGIAELARFGEVRADDLIVIHDAARCFVDPVLVRQCVEAAQEHGAATAAAPVVDSLVRARTGGFAAQWVDREGVWAVQTPQVFRFELLQKAHQNADPSATDDASLVAPFCAVKIISGSRENFKLTTPEDYERAKRLFAADEAI